VPPYMPRPRPLGAQPPPCHADISRQNLRRRQKKGREVEEGGRERSCWVLWCGAMRCHTGEGDGLGQEVEKEGSRLFIL
jgi:hypothetical protein